MGTKPEGTGGAAPNAQAALDQAKAEGRTEATASERSRIAAIMDSEEAKGREAQAKHLAFSTDMAPDAAKAILAAGPKAEPAKPGQSAFEQRMNQTRNPEVGLEAGGEADDEEKLATGIVALHRAGRPQKRSA